MTPARNRFLIDESTDHLYEENIRMRIMMLDNFLFEPEPYLISYSKTQKVSDISEHLILHLVPP